MDEVKAFIDLSETLYSFIVALAEAEMDTLITRQEAHDKVMERIELIHEHYRSLIKGKVIHG